jgi:hypothetical protein
MRLDSKMSRMPLKLFVKGITSEPVLIQPDLTKPFELKVDTSGFALGAVLTRRGTDGKKHPIGYYSTTLTEAEQKL